MKLKFEENECEKKKTVKLYFEENDWHAANFSCSWMQASHVWDFLLPKLWVQDFVTLQRTRLGFFSQQVSVLEHIMNAFFFLYMYVET